MSPSSAVVGHTVAGVIAQFTSPRVQVDGQFISLTVVQRGPVTHKDSAVFSGSQQAYSIASEYVGGRSFPNHLGYLIRHFIDIEKSPLIVIGEDGHSICRLVNQGPKTQTVLRITAAYRKLQQFGQGPVTHHFALAPGINGRVSVQRKPPGDKEPFPRINIKRLKTRIVVVVDPLRVFGCSQIVEHLRKLQVQRTHHVGVPGRGLIVQPIAIDVVGKSLRS